MGPGAGLRIKENDLLLEELSNAFGPPGCEDEVRRMLARHLRGQVDELSADALGNLIAFKRGTGPEPRLKVMIDAHTDEVGLMIVSIQKNGMLGFRAVGGLDARLLLAKRVIVGEKRIPGVIPAPPIHLTKEEQMGQTIPIEQLVIDIGASSEEEAKGLVKLGDYAVPDTRFEILSEDGLRTVKGKAFDDRAGCAVAAALADGQYAVDLYLSFSAQEEVGMRGARVAAYRIAPDLAFALEGTVCNDMPKKQDVSPTTRAGQGTGDHDHGPLVHRRQAAGPAADRCGGSQRHPLPVQAAGDRRHRRRGDPSDQDRCAVGDGGGAVPLHSQPGEHPEPERS